MESTGRGFAVCRNDTHSNWGAPAAVRIEGGSVGFQIGASATDLVMLVMDQSSVRGLLSSQFTLGGGAEVAAGPVGRSGSAQTDATFRAKILSYSRSRGAFAGIALTGATLRQDLDENAELYGQPVTNKQVLEGSVHAPRRLNRLLTLLERSTPARKSGSHGYAAGHSVGGGIRTRFLASARLTMGPIEPEGWQCYPLAHNPSLWWLCGGPDAAHGSAGPGRVPAIRFTEAHL